MTSIAEKIYPEDLLQRVKEHLSRIKSKELLFPRFIFLCGKAYNPEDYEKTNRGIVQSYLQTNSDNIFCVLSEKCWESDSSKEIDLLTFEEVMAEISDYIILFVESMGSACELGAFTFSERRFCKKLTIVLDKQYEHHKSFINQGPIEKAKGNQASVIYSDFSKALLGNRQILSAIKEMIKPSQSSAKNSRLEINRTEEKVNVHSFIIELFEIITVFQPVHSGDIIELYKNIKNFTSFHLIKSNGEKLNPHFSPKDFLNLLEVAKLVTKDPKEYYSVPFPIMKKFENLMFRYNKPNALNKIRSRLLALKYKYGEL